MYIVAPMRHIQAVNAWAGAYQATTTLDLASFELEVKVSNRYYLLYPQFLSKIDGRMVYTPKLTVAYAGFIGWLPYRPVSWPFASDKLAFKSFLARSGLRSPEGWRDPREATRDFVVKSGTGSFGYGLDGPFRLAMADAAAELVDSGGDATGSGRFAEQFVEGRILKVWYWGGTPFHAHLHAYPTVVGDGTTTMERLVAQRLETAGVGADDSEMTTVRAALAYQGVGFRDVLARGRHVWLDFRYGRRMAPAPLTEVTDNDLLDMDPALRSALEHAGQLVAAELGKQVAAPVLYSLDAVVDRDGTVWWLEMNSNPQVPPTAYPHVFRTLFGTPLPDFVRSGVESTITRDVGTALRETHAAVV